MEFLGVWLGSDHGWVPITMPWTKNKEATYFSRSVHLDL